MDEKTEFKWLLNLEASSILNGKISLPTYLYPNSLVRMDFRFINLWGLLKQPDLNLICCWMGGGRDLHNATLSVPLKFDPALVLPGGLAKTLLSLTLRVSISVGGARESAFPISSQRTPMLLCAIDFQHVCIQLSSRVLERRKEPVRTGVLGKSSYTLNTPEWLRISLITA